MTKKFKLLLVTLLIVCFTSNLIACSNSNVTDNNETTTTTEKVTTTEPPTTTEEPTTEEPTTKYVFKGRKFAFFESNFNLKNDLTINPGDVTYINDYVSNPEEDYDSVRGVYIVALLAMTETTNEIDLLNELNAKYSDYGSSTIYIPFEDNYSFEYVGDKKVIFKFVEYNKDGEAVYDVYKE